MGDLLACRVCLATDNVKLYNLFKIHLAQAYEDLTGFKVTRNDGYPQHICSYCSALLCKSVSFKQKCITTNDILKYSAGPDNKVTNDKLRHINLQHELPYSQANHYGTACNKCDNVDEMKLEIMPSIIEIIKTEDSTTKTEGNHPNTYNSANVKSEETSDVEEIMDNDDNNYDMIYEIDCNDEIKDIDSFEIDPSGTYLKRDGAKILDFNDDLKDTDVLVLSKEEQLAEIEARKTSANYLNSFYKCDQCYKGFITEGTYKNHMVRHDPLRGSHRCEICGSHWASVGRLRTHMHNSHELKFVCKLCDYVSRSRHQAKEHVKWHSGCTFDCKTCGATFSKSTSLLTHIRLQHPSDSACEICGESFIGVIGLKMHKKKAHSASSQFLCSVCNINFASEEACTRHMQDAKDNVCDPSIRPCPQCGEGFESEETLEVHTNEQHKDNPVSCEECQRTFSNERTYNTHYRRVHLGVRAKQNKPRTYHRRPRATVVCEICGKECVTNASLMYHQRIHTGEKPYECSLCSKRFSAAQRLQIHIRTHTGEAPYKCQACPKAFKHKAALNRHIRVHTGAKPYSCPHCEKSFSQSNSRKQHVNTVHLKMPAPYRNRRTKVN